MRRVQTRLFRIRGFGRIVSRSDLTDDDQPVVVDFRLSVAEDIFRRGIVIG